ncbi:uncharacterized protein LOC143350286 isoform X3 [Colletes latitarsis]|uniref:uncharacterized protein LOC143350286 isoform X3 n=1 Tax=Colletes latitarsis TaxID=2605962 RepID=UPI0040360CB2
MIDRLEISATLSVELTLEILCVSRALQSLEIIGEHAFRRNNPVQRSRPLACRISLTCFKVYFKVSDRIPGTVRNAAGSTCCCCRVSCCSIWPSNRVGEKRTGTFLGDYQELRENLKINGRRGFSSRNG